MYASSCICAAGSIGSLLRCDLLDQRVLVVLLEDDVVFAAVGGGRGREERGRDLRGQRRGRRGRGRRGGGRRGGRRGRHAQPGDQGRSGVRRANKTTFNFAHIEDVEQKTHKEAKQTKQDIT